MPGPLISRQDIANGAVSGQPRKFSKFGGKQRASRVFFYFRTANQPTSMPHALARTPDGFRVVRISAPASIVVDCVTTNLSATVTSTNGFGGIGEGPVYVGAAISGTGIPGGATVTAKASDSSITISAAATATVTPPATVALTFNGSGQVAPGTVYASPGVGAGNKNDSLYHMTTNYVVLACTTANTWAEVEVF